MTATATRKPSVSKAVTPSAAAAAAPSGALFDLPLDGVTYYFVRKPKAIHLMMLADLATKEPGKVLGFINEWFTSNVGKAQAKAVLGKLEGFDSTLDIETLVEFMGEAVEAAAEVPTS